MSLDFGLQAHSLLMLEEENRSYFPEWEPYQEPGREFTDVEGSRPAACDPSLMAVDEAEVDDLRLDENLDDEDPGDGLEMEELIREDGDLNDDIGEG